MMYLAHHRAIGTHVARRHQLKAASENGSVALSGTLRHMLRICERVVSELYVLAQVVIHRRW
jgi:hypothetical protein